MLFSRIANIVYFGMTMGLLASATPIANDASLVEKRQEVNQLEAVFTQLQTATDSILPQLESQADNNQVSSSSTGPLLEQLLAAFDTADQGVQTYTDHPPSHPSHPPPNKDIIGGIIGVILVGVIKIIHKIFLKSALIPSLLILIGKLGIVIHKILFAIEILVPGILLVVKALLVTVSHLLVILGWTLILVLLQL